VTISRGAAFPARSALGAKLGIGVAPREGRARRHALPGSELRIGVEATHALGAGGARSD